MLKFSRTNSGVLVLSALFCLLAGCGINTPGKMEWVQPHTTSPRVGNVYAIRGWQGIYSAGIDQMARQLSEKGVTANAYMPDQYPELCKAIIARYKGVADPEPIIFIGHSRGCDSSIIIARELAKSNIAVDMIVTLDSVDEKTIPKNVKLVHNYWMPGVFGDSNLLRGVPLTPDPGFTGKINNYNLDKEYREWRGPLSDHIQFDDDPMIQKRIVEQILEICPERSKWRSPSRASAAR